jgi:putative ABC transport system permease protein
MFERDTWQEIYSVLRKNKMRTFITAFGVIWGIFMLVLLLGSGAGLKNAVFNMYGNFATNSIFMWSQQTTIPYQGFRRGRQIIFNDSDTKTIKNKIEEIQYITPRINITGWGLNSIVVRKKESESFNIMADYPDYIKIDPLDIVKGRYINDTDIEEQRKTAVIGNSVYESLYKPGEDPIGTYIKVNDSYFQVVGWFTSQHEENWGEWQNSWVVLPFTTAKKIYSMGDVVGWYAITAKPDYTATKTGQKIRTLLKQRHHIAPEDNDAIGEQNVEEEYRRMVGLFKGINFLILIVGLGTLLAGVIGVSNIMLITINERTREIGIKRALGATPVKIITQILYEAVALTFIAGYIGLFIGLFIVELVNQIISRLPEQPAMFQNPSVDVDLVLWALLIIVISGLFAGIMPARRAVRIKPIEAIRI